MQTLVRQQYPQIADVVACGPSDDGIADSVQQREGIEICQRLRHIEAVLPRALHGGAVHYRACGLTVAINAVRACAQYGDLLARNLLRTIERELLIAPANAGLRCHLHRDLTAGNEA